MNNENIVQLAINTIRTLSIDAVQQAKSGHPGTPMALAPLIYTLWNRVMQFEPADPIWPNRDWFVLSNGHASMLLWSILHQPDWSQQSHSLVFSADLPEENLSFFIVFNAYWEPLEFELPAERQFERHPWRRWIDTSLESPNDIQDWPTAPGYGANVSCRTSFSSGAYCRCGHHSNGFAILAEFICRLVFCCPAVSADTRWATGREVSGIPG